MPLEFIASSNAQIYNNLDTKQEKLYVMKFVARKDEVNMKFVRLKSEYE